MYTKIRNALTCAALVVAIAIGSRIFIVIGDVERIAKSSPGAVDARLDSIQRDLDSKLDAAIGGLNGQATEMRLAAVGQIAGTRRDLSSQITALRGDVTGVVLKTVDDRLASIQHDANGQMDKLNETVAGTAAPVGDFVRAYTIPHREVEGLVGQSMGLIAASKVTMGQVAKMAKTVDSSSPQFISTWQEIGHNVDAATAEATKASKATAVTMKHIADASKPLPTWLRITLGVGPPVAQMGAAAASTGQLLGWLK